MVSRQRQPKITQKGSEMSSSRFASVLQIIFLNKPPSVVPHHVFVILSLVMMLKVQYILMKALTLLLWSNSPVLLEFVKMRVKVMDFEKHSASHFGILNQLQIVFSLVITQEAMNKCNKTVPSRFLLPVQQLGELVTFYHALDLRSNEDTSLDLYLGQLWKKNLEVHESCWLLVKSSDKLLDVQWWHQHLLRFYQQLPLDVALPHTEFRPLWPVLSVIVRCSVMAVPGEKETRTFCETALKAHQEWHHF